MNVMNIEKMNNDPNEGVHKKNSSGIVKKSILQSLSTPFKEQTSKSFSVIPIIKEFSNNFRIILGNWIVCSGSKIIIF